MQMNDLDQQIHGYSIGNTVVFKDMTEKKMSVVSELLFKYGSCWYEASAERRHSRLSSNAVFEVQPTNFNILDLTNELEDIFFNMADDKDLSLNFQVQGDFMLDRNGDYGKLRQVLINIMGNAIKFTHSGRVEVTVLQGASEGDHTFNVVDTGDGISEEQMAHIFTAYHLVPGSDSFRQEGSGLGLSISNTLTTIMGSTLNVESELGKGARFTFRLPLKPLMGTVKKKLIRLVLLIP